MGQVIMTPTVKERLRFRDHYSHLQIRFRTTGIIQCLKGGHWVTLLTKQQVRETLVLWREIMKLEK